LTPPGNQIRLFARGDDGALYQRLWSRQTDWTPWESAGYRPNGGPDAAWAGTLIVVVRGADNALYYKEGGGSTGWQKWPGLRPLMRALLRSFRVTNAVSQTTFYERLIR
jgi:hypothetical protein